MKDGREIEGSKNVATAEPYMMEPERKRVRSKTGGMDRVPGTSGDAIGFRGNQGRRGGGKCL